MQRELPRFRHSAQPPQESSGIETELAHRSQQVHAGDERLQDGSQRLAVVWVNDDLDCLWLRGGE